MKKLYAFIKKDPIAFAFSAAFVVGVFYLAVSLLLYWAFKLSFNPWISRALFFAFILTGLIFYIRIIKEIVQKILKSKSFQHYELAVLVVLLSIAALVTLSSFIYVLIILSMPERTISTKGPHGSYVITIRASIPEGYGTALSQTWGPVSQYRGHSFRIYGYNDESLDGLKFYEPDVTNIPTPSHLLFIYDAKLNQLRLPTEQEKRQ